MRTLDVISMPLLAAGGSLGLAVLATLAVAAGVALLAQRLRLPAAPAFLVAGVAAGPAALGVVSSPEDLTEIGHVATMLLLFGIGLEMRFDRSGPWREGLRLTGAGVLACVLCTLAGWPVAVAFGLSSKAGIAVAMALSLSSTALVLRALSLRRELRQPQGRACLAVLIVQDLAALVMLAVMPLLAQQGNGDPADLAGEAAISLAGVSFLVIAGKLLAGRILKEAARGPEGAQLMTIVAVVMAVGAGIATQRLGLSPELGAFLAGFLLADTSFRHQIAGAIAPMRDVLIAVFFTSVGMAVDPLLALKYWWVILLATIAIAVIKSVSIGGALWTLGSSPATSLRAGVSLAHGGEFSLVVLTAAALAGVIDETVYSLCVAIIVLSLIATPQMMHAARRVSTRATRWPTAPWIRGGRGEGSGAGLIGHVIIAGFGPVGRALADQLRTIGVEYVVIDLNPDTVTRQEKLGVRVIYGDAANPEILEAAGVHHAAAVALTIPDDRAAVRACSVAVRLAPDVFIVARMSTLGQSNLARSSGAREVVVEEITAAMQVRDLVVKRVESMKETESQAS